MSNTLNDLAFFGIAPGVVFQGSDTTPRAAGGGGGGGGSDQWSFLTKAQKQRLGRISDLRMLFEGYHREYYLEQGRTQFAFANLRVSGVYGEDDRQLYIVDNILEKDSKKSADLLYGEEPIIRVAAPGNAPGGEAFIVVQEQAQRGFIADLSSRCNLAALLHEKAVDAAVDGEAYFETRIEAGQVWVVGVPSWELFPVGTAGADQQYGAYDRFRLADIGAENAPVYILLITHYLPGAVDRELWQIVNGKKAIRLSLDQWPLEAGEPPLVEHQPSGLAGTNITRFLNQVQNGVPCSDYSRTVINLQDAHNAKMSQLAWVIAQHARPKLSRSSRHADPDGHSSNFDVEYNDDPANASRYIVWDGQLQWAVRDRDFTLGQLLMALESSPVLLGINLGENAQHATAFKSFRLMATNALAKAARKSNYQKAGITRLLGQCCELAQTLPGVRFAAYPVAITLRDGIPMDALEEAQRLATLRGAGLMSLKRGVNEQINDPAEAEDEIEELQEENKAATPSILLGESGEAGGGGGGGGGAGQQGAAGPTPEEQEQAADEAIQDDKDVAG